jgi:drug/metabolite transporter (DMT)-like permease
MFLTNDSECASARSCNSRPTLPVGGQPGPARLGRAGRPRQFRRLGSPMSALAGLLDRWPQRLHAQQARAWLPSFLVLGVFWGSSFAFIRVGLEALSPVQVVFWRLLLGLTALLMISGLRRTALPQSARTWGHLAVLAVLLNAAPFTLFAIGQQTVPSLLAGIINAATPLATLLVVLVMLPEEKPTRERVAGLLVGFAGILVVLGAWRGFPGGQLSGVVACLLAVGCYGVALPYARRYLTELPEGPLALATGQVACATALMLPVLLVTGVRPEGAVTARIVVAVVMLGVLSTGLAYVLNFHVIATAGATTASSVTYLTPLVAAVVGVGLLGERLTWNQPAGALVVLAGVALAQGRLGALQRRSMPASNRVSE